MRNVGSKEFLEEINGWKDALDRAISLETRTWISLPYSKITLSR